MSAKRKVVREGCSEAKARHFLSLNDLGTESLLRLVSRALDLSQKGKGVEKTLQGTVAGIYFRRSSTRTRSAFTVGALRLGAQTICYGPNDLQIATGETIGDTARVLSGFLDVLVIRTNDSFEEMRVLASQDRMAVINAMSEDEHPTQAIADLVTICEALGRLDDVHVLYVGEGNNTAAALALAVARVPGMALTLVTPEGYGLSADLIQRARATAKAHGSFIEQHHDVDRLPRRVDAVYATRWQTMGVPKQEPNWQEKFEPFSVTPELMSRVSKPEGTIFLHDLPAVRGVDVADEVLDGPQSRAFRQAEHKLTSAMAILEWCAAGN